MKTPNLTENKRGNCVRAGRFARQIMAIIKVTSRATIPPPQPKQLRDVPQARLYKIIPGGPERDAPQARLYNP